MKEKDDKLRMDQSLLTKDKMLLEHPFSVPEGYFVQLQQDIQTRIAEEQLRTQVPVSGMTAPEGYFETLSTRIQQAVGTEKKLDTGGGVIRRMFRPVALRYVAAAVVLFFSVLLIKDKVVDQRDSFSHISDQELVQYLQFYGGTGDAIVISENLSLHRTSYDPMSDLSADEIEWYLENTL